MANPEISSYSEYESKAPVEPHDGAEFFSSILWDIYNSSIGKSKSDFLVYDALYRVTNNPDFLGFRDAMMSADYEAYQGSDVDAIQNTFADRGVGGYAPPDVGINGPAGLFVNQTGTFTADVSNGHPPYQNYKWYYDYNGNTMQLFAQGTATVQFTPTQTGSLHLQLIVTDSKDADGSGIKTVLVASHGGGF